MAHPRLTFHGAAGAVTGSCFRLSTDAGQVLIDCGMFQGSRTEKELNYRPFPFAPGKVAAAILSHAHIDHSGLLPKLVRHGFSGAIHATPATIDLAGVMLPDSAHIQEIEVEQFNRRAVRRNRDRVEPIFDGTDVAACLDLFRPQGLGEWFAVLPGLRARFWNAGHLLGSASVEIELAQDRGNPPLRLLFSADIGPNYKLMHSDPQGPERRRLPDLRIHLRRCGPPRCHRCAPPPTAARRGEGGDAPERRATDPVLRRRAGAGTDQRHRSPDRRG